MDDLLPGMLHLVRDDTETLMRQLTDQLRLLITGGRRGIGRAIAVAMAEQGAAIALHHGGSEEEWHDIDAAMDQIDRLADLVL